MSWTAARRGGASRMTSGERRRGDGPEHQEDDARDVHAPRFAVRDRRAQGSRESAHDFGGLPDTEREAQACPAGLGQIRVEPDGGRERLARQRRFPRDELAAAEERRREREVGHPPDLDLLRVLQDLVDLPPRERRVAFLLCREPAEPLAAHLLAKRGLRALPGATRTCARAAPPREEERARREPRHPRAVGPAGAADFLSRASPAGNGAFGRGPGGPAASRVRRAAAPRGSLRARPSPRTTTCRSSCPSGRAGRRRSGGLRDVRLAPARRVRHAFEVGGRSGRACRAGRERRDSWACGLGQAGVSAGAGVGGSAAGASGAANSACTSSRTSPSAVKADGRP